MVVIQRLTKAVHQKGEKNFALCDESRFLLQHFRTQIRTECGVNNMKKRILSALIKVLGWWCSNVLLVHFGAFSAD